MLHLFFPVGNGSGWDTCGKYLALEMSKIGHISLVTKSQITPEKIGNELEYLNISQIPINTIERENYDRKKTLIKGASIRMLNDFDLSLWLEDIRSERTIGYTFYYGHPLSDSSRHTAESYDLIVAGSSFCEVQLNRLGLNRTKTIVQGINPQIFNSVNSSKSLLQDNFVIFSGGKLEFRKGQDIVIRVFKIFSDRHPEAILVNSWFNQWEFSLNTMAASTLIDFNFGQKDYIARMNDLFKKNEIEPKKVITLPIMSPQQLSYIFKNTDIGIFPNRCEGGTNLMMMEYMACGKPVIASSKTGHANIVNDDNAFEIKNYHPVKTMNGYSPEYVDWEEPDIDEIVSQLESAYENFELRKKKGEAAGRFLADLTWRNTAMKFYQTAMEFI